MRAEFPRQSGIGSSWAGIVASRPRRPSIAVLAALLAATASLAHGAGAPGGATGGAWRALPGGLELRSLDLPARAEAPDVAWLVRLDPAAHRLVSAAPTSQTGAFTRHLASPFAAESGALAVINAAYFDERGHPVGALVSGGRQIQAVNRRGWAWAAIASGRLVLGEAAAPLPAGTTEAVQAGPLLVMNGKARTLTSPRVARRSFVGQDAQGRIVIGATTGAVTLGELARLLARSPADGGAGLAAAINLDGGSSSQLHVAGSDPALLVAGVPVPSFLAVQPQ